MKCEHCGREIDEVFVVYSHYKDTFKKLFQFCSLECLVDHLREDN